MSSSVAAARGSTRLVGGLPSADKNGFVREHCIESQCRPEIGMTHHVATHHCHMCGYGEPLLGCPVVDRPLKALSLMLEV